MHDTPVYEENGFSRRQNTKITNQGTESHGKNGGPGVGAPKPKKQQKTIKPIIMWSCCLFLLFALFYWTPATPQRGTSRREEPEEKREKERRLEKECRFLPCVRGPRRPKLPENLKTHYNNDKTLGCQNYGPLAHIVLITMALLICMLFFVLKNRGSFAPLGLHMGTSFGFFA